MDLIKQNDFTLLTGYAKAIAQHVGKSELSPEHYVAGAWVACQRGELDQFPTLLAHIEAHDAAIQSLLKENGWIDLNNLVSPVADVAMPVSEDLRAALNITEGADNPLFRFLNGVIEQGVKLYNLGPTAYHEAGHAIISLVLRPEVRIGKASIKPEGDAAGYVSYFGIAGPSTREDFLESLCVSLAGQVAQVKKYGLNAADSGAVSDIAKATQVAWQSITEFGLDEEFGPVNLLALADAMKSQVARLQGGDDKALPAQPDLSLYRGWLYDEAQRRLQKIMKEANVRTVELVSEHWGKIDQLAQLLMEKKVVGEDEIRKTVSFYSSV